MTKHNFCQRVLYKHTHLVVITV